MLSECRETDMWIHIGCQMWWRAFKLELLHDQVSVTVFELSMVYRMKLGISSISVLRFAVACVTPAVK